MAKELQITRQGIIRGLLDAVEMGREQQNSGAMVTALRELSKMLGFNAPEVKRVELTSDQQIIQNHMAALTDAQLLVLMQGHTALV